jgi:hypothetical protein
VVEGRGGECLRFITFQSSLSPQLSSHLTGSRGRGPGKKKKQLSAEKQKAKASAGQGFSR